MKKEKSIFKDVLLLKLIILIILISIIFCCLTPVDIIIAENFKTGEVLKKWILKENIFTISYTHSVMLSEVTESYILKDDKIILMESTFKDYGAGLPSSTPYDFKIDEETGLFKIFNINKEIDPLIYGTGTERANHKIIIDNENYEFLDFSRPRDSVKLTYKRENRLKYIK